MSLHKKILKTDFKNKPVAKVSDNPAPEKKQVAINADIRFSDTDANGHVFFGNYFTLFDTAFLKYLKIIGYSFNRFLQNNLNFYYVEAKSQYKSPVKFDDELCIKVFADHLGKTSFTIKFEAMNKTSNKIAALGHIVAVVVDQKTEKPSPLPDEFIKVLNSL
ncbi:MAG: acyl-CoA thioesterase [Desulfobacula sp.]|nr:acyl-CoA thioesterase [Desulfobacula sp.]MBT7048584.1 acyl-CoA thioesterase [Desulfobacula sp.]